LIKVFKPTEVQNIQREKGMKIDPLLLPGKVSGISKNRCPIYSGITVRIGQELLSGLGKNMHLLRIDYVFVNCNRCRGSCIETNINA